MSRTTRRRPLRATASALAITAACFTTVACGSDGAEDGGGQEMEQEMDEGTENEND